MSISERQSEAKLPVRLTYPSENVLLASIAVGFFVLHILVAALLMPAATGGPLAPEEQALARLCD